jgi:glucose/arabinose dehydrogenase
MSRLDLVNRSAIFQVGFLLVLLLLAACSPAPGVTPPSPTTQPEASATTALESTATSLPPPATPTPVTPTATEMTQPEPTVAPASGAAPGPADAGSFPDPQEYTWSPLVSGLQRPTDLVDIGGAGLLVLEQPGRVRVIADGLLLPDPFLDLTSRVGSSANEQGLLGIALHPDFPDNGFFFLNYTNLQGNTVVSRFQATSTAGEADAGSEKILLTIAQPYGNHNGGSLAFGPDGYLYIGMGDGGSGGDPQGNGQNLTALLGKILRIDVDGGDPYAIPPDNPFADGQSGRPEIWAYGLRNPWRISFDRANGDFYTGDVGQNQWEEIDYLPEGAPAGANFGWNYREGANPYQGVPPAGLELVEPVAQYQHPEGCSVSGGFVYRGTALPEFNGIYLYGDYCNGRIWGLLRQGDGSWANQFLFDSGALISSFAQDSDGELYLLDHSSGSVLLLERKSQ